MVAVYTMMPPRVESELTEGEFMREQLMLEIQSMNPTASRDYLVRFSAGSLRTYLEHLQATLEPRGRMATWVRRGDTPAIIGFPASEE